LNKHKDEREKMKNYAHKLEIVSHTAKKRENYTLVIYFKDGRVEKL